MKPQFFPFVLALAFLVGCAQRETDVEAGITPP